MDLSSDEAVSSPSFGDASGFHTSIPVPAQASSLSLSKEEQNKAKFESVVSRIANLKSTYLTSYNKIQSDIKAVRQPFARRLAMGKVVEEILALFESQSKEITTLLTYSSVLTPLTQNALIDRRDQISHWQSSYRTFLSTVYKEKPKYDQLLAEQQNKLILLDQEFNQNLATLNAQLSEISQISQLAPKTAEKEKVEPKKVKQKNFI